MQVTDPPALAVDNEGALVGYVVLEGGRNEARFAYIPASSEVDADGLRVGTEAASTRQPFLARAQSGFVAAYRQEFDGSIDIYAEPLALRAGAGADPILIATGAPPPSLPFIGVGGTAPFVAWVEGTDGDRVGRIRRIASSPTPAVTVAALGALLGRPVLAPLASGGALYAWVDGESRRVRIARVDDAGVKVGETQDLSVETGASSGLDVALAAGAEAGAFVFDMRVGGTRPEVRLRTFNSMGELTGVEKVVTTGDALGSGASITALRGGYVVAYRATADAGEASALHAAFMDANGELLEVLELASLDPPSRPVVVRSSPDGKLVYVAYTDDQAMRLTLVRCE